MTDVLGVVGYVVIGSIIAVVTMRWLDSRYPADRDPGDYFLMGVITLFWPAALCFIVLMSWGLLLARFTRRGK